MCVCVRETEIRHRQTDGDGDRETETEKENTRIYTPQDRNMEAPFPINFSKFEKSKMKENKGENQLENQVCL